MIIKRNLKFLKQIIMNLKVEQQTSANCMKMNVLLKTKYESELHLYGVIIKEYLQRECLHCGYTWKEMCKHEGTGE